MMDAAAEPNLLLSAPGEDPVVLECWFKATPERLFKAWTTPKDIQGWFGRHPHAMVRAEIDLREGGEYKFVMMETPEKTVWFAGKYVVIDAPRALSFTWTHNVLIEGAQLEATPQSVVTISISPSGAGANLKIIHAAISTEDARKSIGGGWPHSMRALGLLLEEEG